MRLEKTHYILLESEDILAYSLKLI